jgi:hypothetical protein
MATSKANDNSVSYYRLLVVSIIGSAFRYRKLKVHDYLVYRKSCLSNKHFHVSETLATVRCRAAPKSIELEGNKFLNFVLAKNVPKLGEVRKFDKIE